MGVEAAGAGGDVSQHSERKPESDNVSSYSGPSTAAIIIIEKSMGGSRVSYGSWPCENGFWPPWSPSGGPRLAKERCPEQIFAARSVHRPTSDGVLGPRLASCRVVPSPRPCLASTP